MHKKEIKLQFVSELNYQGIKIMNPKDIGKDKLEFLRYRLPRIMMFLFSPIWDKKELSAKIYYCDIEEVKKWAPGFIKEIEEFSDWTITFAENDI
jgi:hypothetical protein